MSYKTSYNIVNAPRYIRNDELHKDLQMEYVNEKINKNARKHKQCLEQH